MRESHIKIRVKASASREEVRKISSDKYEISVKESASENMANRRVLEILKKELGKATDIRIISGHHSPSKIVRLHVRD